MIVEKLIVVVMPCWTKASVYVFTHIMTANLIAAHPEIKLSFLVVDCEAPIPDDLAENSINLQFD